MDMAEALRTIDTWPLEDRIELVQSVWDSIAASGLQPKPSDAQKADLDRRLEDLEKNPENVVDWESIVRHVRRKR
jgi:putative addiction module component (TIGR02574 family)